MKKKEKVHKTTVKSCCTVKAVVTVDERGQLVLPKELREELGLKAGDKLAIIAVADKGKVCCLTLMKTQEINNMVKIKLGPVFEKMEEGEDEKK